MCMSLVIRIHCNYGVFISIQRHKNKLTTTKAHNLWKQVNNPPGTDSLWNCMNFSNRIHKKKSSVSQLFGRFVRLEHEIYRGYKRKNKRQRKKNVRTRDEICDFPVVGKFKHVQSNWCVSSSWMSRTKRSRSSLLYMPHEIGQLNTLERIGRKKEARAAIQLANKVRRNNGSMSSRKELGMCVCVLLSCSPPRQLGEVNFSFSLSSSVNVEFFFQRILSIIIILFVAQTYTAHSTHLPISFVCLFVHSFFIHKHCILCLARASEFNKRVRPCVCRFLLYCLAFVRQNVFIVWTAVCMFDNWRK